MKYYKISILLIFAAVVSLGFIQQTEEKHPDVDWTLGCQTCHEEMTPDIYEKWHNSDHGMVGFGCYICHGDGQEEFHPTGSDEKCSGCHYEQTESMTAEFDNCFVCHNGHSLKFHQEENNSTEE